MVETASPQQVLLAWLSRSEHRAFWIENTEPRKLKMVMLDQTGGLGQIRQIVVYKDFSHDAKGDVPDHVLTDLMIRGLDKWREKHRTLT